MPSLNDYFREEAREFLRVLDRAVSGNAPDPAELHRATRGLRGSAQMAREERVFRAASAFESATRALASGALSWSADLTDRARATIADLRALLEENADPEEADARADSAAERWQAGAPTAPAGPAADIREFREFTAKEAAGIADTIDQGIQALQADPMDREPLRAILRRQRALLGAARLDEVPVVAEILRAVEDLTKVIAKLDVGVKKEWLDSFRVARDALQATIATLLRGNNPEPTHALSRLRHMRAELLERYGEGEPVSAAHEAQLHQPTPMEAASPLEAAAFAAAAPPAHAEEPVTADGATDAVLELTDIANEEPALELDTDAVVEDEPVLDLPLDSAVEEQVLDLSLDTAIEEEVLELPMAAAVDEGILDLPMESAVDEEPLLDLSMDAAVEEEVLELPADAIVEEDVRDLEMDAVVDADTPRAADVRARVRELRPVIERVAAHDPQARAAVEELFAIVDRTLE